MGAIVKITLRHEFTALTTFANLWIDVAGCQLANCATANDCVEPCFVCNICQIIFNILFTNSPSSTSFRCCH